MKNIRNIRERAKGDVKINIANGYSSLTGIFISI